VDNLESNFPPSLARFRDLWLSRDQLMMLVVTLNLLFLGLDTWIAHLENGTIVPRERIPIVFGFAGGFILFIAGLLAARRRPLATVLATTTLAASIIVGFAGAYFHIMRAALPAAPIGSRMSIDLLVWAPPILGPLAFAVAGVLGISAVFLEDPVDSGILRISKTIRTRLPFSKTRAYFFIVGMGMTAALISSVLDHGRSSYESLWTWFATGVGIYGIVVAVAMGLIDRPTKNDLWSYIGGMLLLVVAGGIGVLVHISSNLVGDNVFVLERFQRGAPILAPLLYANMGLLGLVSLLKPDTPDMDQGPLSLL